MAGILAKSKGRAKNRVSTDGQASEPGPQAPAPRASGKPGPATPAERTPPIAAPAAAQAREVSGTVRRTTEGEGRQAQPAARAARQAGRLRSFAQATEHETQVVTFQLAKEEYAIDILQVQEIVMIIPITRMPKAPHFIEGIVNLRGQMIPIIDMRKRFALGEAEHDSDTRIIIVDIGEIVGMVVDGVRDVIRLPDSAISPPPPMIQGISADYLKGIGQFNERLLIMLDLEKVLTAEEHEVLRELGPDGSPLTKE